MIVYFLAFAVLVLVVTGMSVGVIFSNKPIKGSCGGLGAVGIDGECEICGGDIQKCEEEQERQAKESAPAPAAMFYDADKK
ncbi:(Na+)-NQR maturation NqrM [Teredinibacter turnerae]|uniref:Conserved hypothetical membrane protein DUF539 n=1 Tax=Teredinibacter turnerae (strain ATCC 39867 / T7901) TaxID=377629 RepID=C5BII8_TERTT|nr:(Na+)-NQR maturation NqrM [Teredinibacter turnerae]ACR12636.1 conserved hypothetical membrane protein DUF539 [Teredinibacter turnerae T7901]